MQQRVPAGPHDGVVRNRPPRAPPQTRSPAAKPVTPSPTSSITPAQSLPKPAGSVTPNRPAASADPATFQSTGFSPAVPPADATDGSVQPGEHFSLPLEHPNRTVTWNDLHG